MARRQTEDPFDDRGTVAARLQQQNPQQRPSVAPQTANVDQLQMEQSMANALLRWSFMVPICVADGITPARARMICMQRLAFGSASGGTLAAPVQQPARSDS